MLGRTNAIQVIPKLNAPTVSLNESTLTITDGNNGNFTQSFDIYKNGSFLVNQTGTTYDVSSYVGAYFTALCKAEHFYDSNLSSSIQYNVILATPVISLSGDTLSWSAVTYSSSYRIYESTTLIAEITNTSVDLSTYFTSNGSHTLSVVAVGSPYTNSANSNTQTYERYTVSNNLTSCVSSNSSTIVTKGSSYNATFTATNGYYINYANVTMGGVTQSYTGATDGTASTGSISLTVSGAIVIAVTATYKLSSPTNLSLSGNILSWSAVSNATYYNIYVDGIMTINSVTTTSQSIVTLSSATHSVQVLAGNDNYLDSSLSTALTIYPIALTLTNVVKTSGATFIATTESIVVSASDGYNLPSTITVSGATYTWTQSTGTLVLSNPTGAVSVGITATAELIEETYITFSSVSSFTLNTYNTSKNWNGTLEYSTDTINWTTWSGTSISSAVSSGSYKLYVRGTGNSYINTLSLRTEGRWVLTGSNISCSGNINSLLDYSTVSLGGQPTMDICCYRFMFYGCTSLTSAPSLPATTMTLRCYSNMFQDCTSLTTAPSLPATTLANYCCEAMFRGCTSLTSVPSLSATALADGCYREMFYGCTLIKLSTTQNTTYKNAYRIPTTDTGTDAGVSMASMFASTGGTFTGTPTINTTYYTSNTIV